MTMPAMPPEAEKQAKQHPRSLNDVLTEIKEAAQAAFEQGRGVCLMIENRAPKDEFAMPRQMMEQADHIICLHQEPDQSLEDVVVTTIKSRNGEFDAP